MKASKKKLVIGIDASRSAHPKPTGVERYSTEILSALLKEPMLKGAAFRLYTPQKLPAFPASIQRVLRCPRLWTLVRLSLEMLFHKPDILFVPAHVLPFFAPRRSFVMIHDLAFEKIPGAYGRFQANYLRWSTRRALQKCEKVLVPSRAVADDLCSLYGANPDQLLVIPHGPLSLLLPSKKLPGFKAPTFFYLGRLESKKNLGVLAEAFRSVQKKYSTACLVLAGRPGYGWDTLAPQLENQPGIELPGFMSEKEVARHFLGATAFVFPSLEEGFGFPILQAFEAGCPVLCSDIPVLREVAGDAGVYVKPDDAEGFAKAMLRLIEEPESASVLTLRGQKRAKDFSWEKSAKRLAELWRRHELA